MPLHEDTFGKITFYLSVHFILADDRNEEMMKLRIKVGRWVKQ
jgi:hypothetical protein